MIEAAVWTGGVTHYHISGRNIIDNHAPHSDECLSAHREALADVAARADVAPVIYIDLAGNAH